MNSGLEGAQAHQAGEAHVPVLRLGDVLLVTLQGELQDTAAVLLQQDIAEEISRTAARGVVIDVSGVQIVDSFLGRVLAEIAAGSALLAARTVVAGMRPAVAITLVELGLTLPGLRTALNAEEALRLLGAPSAVTGGRRRPPAGPAVGQGAS